MQRLQIRFVPAACIIFALTLLILPIKWIFAALAAAIIHELFHVAAVAVCGGKISILELGGSGAIMESTPMSRGKELFCTMSGPLGGLALLFFARWIPRVAVCAAFHSLYNLLPVYPLDGGRALRCGMEILVPQFADSICKYIECFTFVGVAVISIYACFRLKLGIMPIAFALGFWLKVKNTTCKELNLKLQ